MLGRVHVCRLVICCCFECISLGGPSVASAHIVHACMALHVWSDFDGFKAALKRAWAKASSPANCRKLFAGLAGTWNACIRNGGASVKGWGKTAH